MIRAPDRWMVLIAGPMRSGKSTFAHHVVGQFGGVRVSFGGAIRRRALALGRTAGRTSLQQVGEQWVANDPAGLCDDVMAPVAGRPQVVVDGVRHMHVYNLLKARAKNRRVMLVFVDTDPDIRRVRLRADEADDATVNAIMAHSTESELPFLRDVADLVIDGAGNAAWALSALAAMLGPLRGSEK